MVDGKKEDDCIVRIGIDGRLWTQSGVGRYIRNLVSNLEEIDKKNEYYIFLLKPQYDSLVYHHKNFKKILANFTWYSVAEQVKFPQLLNKNNLDLVHFPHFNIPIFYKGKFVVTIHDLIHQHFQMRRATTRDPIIYKIKQLGYKTVFKNAVKNSSHILVPSNYVKDLLISEWKISKDKITVTCEAVEEDLLKIINKNKPSKKVLDKFNVKPPYIYYVGNAHPHKNVEGLIKAFLNLRKKYQYLQLVLSGNDHYFWDRIKQSLESRVKRQGNIIFTGYVSDEELVALYKSAQVYVMPSLEEGFGIPLLEAMACNTPVVSSNAGSLKEIGGDAALYFDPKNISDMEDKIMKVLNDQILRKQLIEKGDKRYKEFNWKKLTEQTLRIYKT